MTPATSRASPTATELAPGPAPDNDVRWPGAPEPIVEDGLVRNAREWCRTCESPSTLIYRCSECGADLAHASSGAGGRG